MKIVLPYQGLFLRNPPAETVAVLYKYGLGLLDIHDLTVRFWAYHRTVGCTGTEVPVLAFEFMEWVFEDFPDIVMSDYDVLVQAVCSVFLELRDTLDSQVGDLCNNEDVGVSRVYQLDPMVEIYK